MPQFKECTVDELLKDSLIEFSLKHNNKTMFDFLTGEDWKDHVVKEDRKNTHELHNDLDDKYINCPECEKKGFDIYEGYCLNCGWDVLKDEVFH